MMMILMMMMVDDDDDDDTSDVEAITAEMNREWIEYRDHFEA
jgi:hypothetical protein